MEKQSLLADHIKRVTQPSLGLFGILREAFKTSFRNGKIMFFIMLIMFSYYNLTWFANHVVLTRILEDFQANSRLLPSNSTFADADPAFSKAFLKDARCLLAYHFVTLSFLCLVLMFAVAATVHSTFEAYTAKVLSPREMLVGTRGKWRRVLKTSIWIIVISLACVALFFFGFGIFAVMTGLTGDAVSSPVVYLTALCVSVYLSSLWMLALVVSVVEDKFSGLKAITEANELMKGKRVQGFVLMLIKFLVGAAISQAFYYMETFTTPAASQNADSLGTVLGFAFSVPKNLLYCALKLFVFAVYTLFYTECKKSHSVEERY